MSRVLNVFYGADRLPYKDQERQVHYPIVGNSFAGASLVDEIRFYAKDLGTENNVFVGIAKRPDGQRGYQVLTYGYDTEINEPYWTFNVAGWFTEKVGNVFVSLNVYEGGVDIKVNQDNGLSIVSGTPIIQATGSVVVSINYAPIMDNGYGAVPTIDVQEALSLVGSKVNTDYLTSNYYNKTDVDNKLLLKADLDYVNHFVKTLEVSMDSSTYVLTFTCKDGTGTTIYNQSIDLPLESVVVSGEYDNNTKSIILTLQNGNTITIPVSDLVDGLVDTTTFETAIQGIQNELSLKANANEVYTKVEVDNKLDLKADKTTTASLQNQINDLNSRLVVVEEAIVGVDTLTYTALSYSAIPSVSDNLYPLIQSGGLDTKEVKGNSFVHTQLCKNNGLTETINGVTITNNNNGTWTLNGTASADFDKRITAATSDLYLTAQHKYLLCGCKGGSSITYGLYSSASVGSFEYGNGTIFTQSSNGNSLIFIQVKQDTNLNNVVIMPQLFDLTKDFGAGNEPTTYDQAVSMYASKGIDITNYVEYTQGTLIDSKPVKLISHGYNLFDGELESGYISTSGVDTPNQSWLRAKNYIKVIQRETYTWSESNFTNFVYCLLALYDANKNFIKRIDITDNRTNYVIPNGCCFVRILYSNNGVSYPSVPANPQIALHITGSRTGYAPYKAPIEYPITTEILRSAGSVQDSAVSKKIGSVDLGTLNWTYNSGRFYVALNGIKKASSYDAIPNLYCSKYLTASKRQIDNSSPDKIIGTGDKIEYIYIIDSDYTDATTFKTAMNGVILNYELATPTEQTATLPTDIEIEKGGSLEVVYDNGNTTPADFVFECAVYKPIE